MKRKGGLTIKINLSNRFLYTFIVLGILAIISVGVYAVVPSVAQNVGNATFGHMASEMNFAGGFNVPSGNIIVGNTTINRTTIKANSLCLGTACRTSINKAVYSITNTYCSDAVGTLSVLDYCLTRNCTGTSNCPGGYTFYPRYQCDGDCGWCVSGGHPEGINTCANTLQGYIAN